MESNRVCRAEGAERRGDLGDVGAILKLNKTVTGFLDLFFLWRFRSDFRVLMVDPGPF